MTRTLASLLLVLALGTSLSGCGKLFGGVDDTVLPGAREDAIPGQSSFPAPGDKGLPTAQDTAASADAAPPPADTAQIDCTLAKNKKDPACTQQSSSDGTFSDGQ